MNTSLKPNLENLKDLDHHERFAVLHTFDSSSRAVRKEISKTSEILDKYYTKPKIAKVCFRFLEDFLLEVDINPSNVLFVEPSAGSGVFLRVTDKPIVGLDIAPNHTDIKKHDFLKNDLTKKISDLQKGRQLIFIGNPPFGKKSKLAIDFVNRAFQYGDVVGFILPIQFRKWSAQSKINEQARLVLDSDLPEAAFEFVGKDYKLRCCFQIWEKTGKVSQLKDLRIAVKPAVNHVDFTAYQYNRTEEAKKFFDYDWDFAVPRQGYLDYSFKAYKKADCDQKQQWIFFKAHSKKALKKLLSLDFVKLSKKNIGLPGFGKADVVKEYIERFGS